MRHVIRKLEGLLTREVRAKGESAESTQALANALVKAESIQEVCEKLR